MSMKALAKTLNITEEKALERVTELKSQDIIHEPYAMFHPESLGLQRVVVITHVPNYTNLRTLEKACDEHPYTIYRGRLFGRNMGLIIQFNIPESTLTLLEEFFTELQLSGLLTEYNIFLSTGVRTQCFPDLSRYNRKKVSWNFIWSMWYATLLHNPPPLPETPEIKEDFVEFTKTK